MGSKLSMQEVRGLQASICVFDSVCVWVCVSVLVGQTPRMFGGERRKLNLSLVSLLVKRAVWHTSSVLDQPNMTHTDSCSQITLIFMVSRFSWRKASFQTAFIWLCRIHVLMRLFAYALAPRTLSPTFLRVCRWASTGAKRCLRERSCMSGLGNSLGTDPSALPVLSHSLTRTRTQKRCHLSNICICAMQMTAIRSVYISVSSNDNYWLQSHLARLH